MFPQKVTAACIVFLSMVLQILQDYASFFLLQNYASLSFPSIRISQALSYLQQGETRGRLPPGQYLERGFPLLSAGPTLHTPLISWEFSIVEEVDQPKRWAWDEFRALCKRLPGRDHESAIATRDELAMPRVSASRHRQLRSPWDKEAVPTPEPTEYCPGGFPAPEGSTSGLRTHHAEPALRRRLTAAAYRA